MSRRSLAVNGGLSVALAASGVAGYLCIGSPVAAQAGTSRTATVTRGTVTATVSASGNAASASTVGLSFGSAGTLTELDVKPGQTVPKGAVLAKIDPAGAQQSLRSAQAQLASAQAQLTAAGTGQTAAAASKDAIAVQQAQQTVSNAGSSVTQATAQQVLDAKQQDQIVAAARLAAARLAAATSAAPSAAAAPSTRASSQLVPSDRRPGAAPTAGVSPGTGGAGTGGGTGSTGTAAASTGARSGGSSGGATSGGGASSLDVVTAAEQTRDQTALRDAQSVTNAQQQLVSAKLQLAAQQATATADAVGPVASGVATAQASVDSATSAVQTAQQTVDETVLHAPSAGTVVSVAGAVGEQVSSSTGGSAASGSGGSGTTGSGTTGSGTTGSGGAGGGAASSSTGSASSAGTSGFLVLTDLTSMQVTTNVAEADAASVQDGQSASITFSASGATATGRVTAVAVDGTTSNNVVNYPVTVTLTSVPKGVRPGATASVVITTSTATDVLELPTAAITSLGSRHTVTLVKGTTRQVTPIEVGVAGGTTTVVTSGLSESDTVELPTTTPSTTTGGLPGFGGAGLGGLGGGGTSGGGTGGGGAGRRGGGG